MDDVKIASKRRTTTKPVQKNRKLWQYMFDLVIKTLLCSLIISIDFTLFANAGSYNLFSTGVYGNLEALYIYGGITAVSFILMFIASFIRPLENILLSAVFALFVVAIVNQFATFEKQSALLLLFDGVFSENINIILYEHSRLIILSVVFVLSWILLSLLNRSFLFYITLGLCAFLGWLISEAYLNPNIKYFNEVAGLPNFKKENMGKNLIFLSFNDLTSINNLKALNNDKENNEALTKAYKNSLAFYNTNNFTLYSNALVEYQDNAFYNLMSSYNSRSEDNNIENNVLLSVLKDSYFDFKTLQYDKLYMKDNLLYDYLRKNDYKINVFQTRELDTCYVNNELTASSCKEKINSPLSLNGEYFTTYDKTVILASQWLESTGLIKSTNPLLSVLQYAGSIIPSEFAPKNVYLGNLYSYNSVKIFDQLIDTIDKLSGNQAYFAVIDLPSNNFVYDEFCKVKPVEQWLNSKNIPYSNTPITKRKQAYAEQINCLYGSLQKFVTQLDIMGELENTTIVIQGLNNPIELMGKKNEYYDQVQSRRNVAFAVRQAYAKKPEINHSVCSINEIINSELFDEKDCTSFDVLKTSDKNIEAVKKAINSNKPKDEDIDNAIVSFNNWFKVWSAHNDFLINQTPTIKDSYIDEASLMDGVIEDTPESEMESISLASDEADIIENTDGSTDETVAEEIIEENEEVKEDKKTSKIEELAKKTFNEINAKVENLKNKETQKSNNIIDKINNVTKDVSNSIDNTIKTMTGKVVKVFDKTNTETVKEVKKEVVKKQVPVIQEAKHVDNVKDIVEEKQESIKDIITKTKKAIREKEETIQNQQIIDENQAVKEKISQQSEELREILEAPVADGQNLSPEELKKIYHNKIKNAVKNTNVQIEVIEK